MENTREFIEFFIYVSIGIIGGMLILAIIRVFIIDPIEYFFFARNKYIISFEMLRDLIEELNEHTLSKVNEVLGKNISALDYIESKPECFKVQGKTIYIDDEEKYLSYQIDKEKWEEVKTEIINCYREKLIKSLISIIKNLLEKMKKIESEIEDLDLKIKKINAKTVSARLQKMREIKDGHEFEHFIGKILAAEGYEVKVTKRSGDFGIDIIAISPLGRKICIQCKHWTGKVGIKALQEVVFGKEFYKCEEAWVISSSGMTENAENAAQKLGIQVFKTRDFIERITTNEESLDEIIDLELAISEKEQIILKYNQFIENIKQTIKSLGKNFEGICPECGANLKLKTGKYGDFVGCSMYPYCKYSRDLE